MRRHLAVTLFVLLIGSKASFGAALSGASSGEDWVLATHAEREQWAVTAAGRIQATTSKIGLSLGLMICLNESLNARGADDRTVVETLRRNTLAELTALFALTMGVR
jgi:hypothetical protein